MEPRETEYLRNLVRELCAYPTENEWVEFKIGQTDPEGIGKRISALANGAALENETTAYLIWGIDDTTHDVVGTRFSYEKTKCGNQQLESWLRATVSSNIDFGFRNLKIDDLRVVILEIEAATHHPVSFRNIEYVRVGQSTEPLTKHPRIAARLWQILDRTRFEDRTAEERLTGEQVLATLNYPAYFRLLGLPIPDGNSNILNSMRQDALIELSDAGGWSITNLAAITIANDLSLFSRLRRKSLRVIRYRGRGKADAERELEWSQGYAVAFEQTMEAIMTLIPSNEVLENAVNRTVPMFPQDAIRELIANALIHQEFSITGTGPTVEIFDDRIEINNPGEPLVETNRFVDAHPRSRNETLASLMRRFEFCEERGRGIDRVVAVVEAYQLPAPRFEASQGFTRATLFGHKPFAKMTKEERIHACYWHACLRHEMSEPTNNQSIRERFGIPYRRSDQASRLLREAVDAGMLIVSNPDAGNKSRTYSPIWAAPSPNL